MGSFQISISLLALIISIIFHEVAHGYIADKLGDPTARHQGRLTLNPIPHIDPVGSVVIPLLLVLMSAGIIFGWAKPVPVNPGYFRDSKRDMMLVALGGPGTNLLLAALAALIFKIFSIPPDVGVGLFFIMMCLINIVLAVLNLLPIPPLDGSRIVTGLLPPHLEREYLKIQPYGFVIVLGFLLLGGLNYIVDPIINGVLSFMAPAGL